MGILECLDEIMTASSVRSPIPHRINYYDGDGKKIKIEMIIVAGKIKSAYPAWPQ
jgi:hypothetical protein